MMLAMCTKYIEPKALYILGKCCARVSVCLAYTGFSPHPSASACQMLGSQACNTTLGSVLGLFLLIFLKLKKKWEGGMRETDRWREGEKEVGRERGRHISH